MLNAQNLFQMNFEWSVKMENETEIHPLESSLEDKENMSFLRISVDKGRTYQCVANNSVGAGTMCSIEITGNVHNFIWTDYSVKFRPIFEKQKSTNPWNPDNFHGPKYQLIEIVFRVPQTTLELFGIWKLQIYRNIRVFRSEVFFATPNTSSCHWTFEKKTWFVLPKEKNRRKQKNIIKSHSFEISLSIDPSLPVYIIKYFLFETWKKWINH